MGEIILVEIGFKKAEDFFTFIGILLSPELKLFLKNINNCWK